MSISTRSWASLALGQKTQHKTERKTEATSALPFFRSLRKRRLALSRSGWAPPPCSVSMVGCLPPTFLADGSGKLKPELVPIEVFAVEVGFFGLEL